MEINDNRTINFLRKKGKELAVIVMILAGVLLILLGSTDFGKEESNAKYTNVEFYTDYLENKIARICENVDGISEASVLLTLECSSEYVYGESASDYIILQNKNEEEAVLLREIYPRVRGIAVVCTGGDIPRIRETVVELLSAAIGIPASKIQVAGM